jgi:hypothetical protein
MPPAVWQTRRGSYQMKKGLPSLPERYTDRARRLCRHRLPVFRTRSPPVMSGSVARICISVATRPSSSPRGRTRPKQSLPRHRSRPVSDLATRA